MFAGLRALQSRSLVVVDPNDHKGRQAAEAHVCVLPLVVVEVMAPANVNNVEVDVDSVAVFCSDVSRFFKVEMQLMVDCLSKLRPGGSFIAHLGGLTDADADGLATTGLFAGAIASTVNDKLAAPGGKFDVWFSCLKPTWTAPAASAGLATIDEDELIGELPKPVGKGKSDCSSQPKACAGCSCGRKELEDELGPEEAKQKLELGTVRSKCGSCYLGDAFRCDGCPYRGIPAFKPGSKVELSDGDAVGIGQLAVKEIAEESVVATDGKCVLVA